jgi:hypothetical protein
VTNSQFLFKPALNSISDPITFQDKPVTILLIRDFLSFAYHKDLQVLADSISGVDVLKGHEASEEFKRLQVARLAYLQQKKTGGSLDTEKRELVQAAYAVPYGQRPDLDTVLKRTDEFVLRFSPANVLQRVSIFNHSQLTRPDYSSVERVFLLVFDQYWDRQNMSHMFRLHVECPKFTFGKHESFFEFQNDIDRGVDSQLICTSLLVSESILNFSHSHSVGGLSFRGNPFTDLPVYCIVSDQLVQQNVTLKNRRKAVEFPFVEFQTFPLSIMKFYGR